MTPTITKCLLILTGAVCVGLSFVLHDQAGPLTTTGIGLLVSGGVQIHDSGHVEVAGVRARLMRASKQ